ncbi:MAG: penicillin-binding protein [Candidatus Solibacter sp.]|nr:penicillin-binding protein [Candidatus Solibacter sp.]
MKRILLVILCLAWVAGTIAWAAQSKKSTARKTSAKTAATGAKAAKAKAAGKANARTRSAVASKKTTAKKRAVRTAKYRKARRVYSPWDTPNFADSTYGDVIDGEDLTVRRAAVAALGPFNGTVVVANPGTGRILTIVNQKLALTGAYQPCSTIKLVAGIAGINEGIIDRETKLRLSRRESMNLTWALAKSNNPYFANIGEKLGFDKVYHYARLLGLGEKSGLDITGESAGLFPDEKPKTVSVGLMTSFGEAIGLTPLQLTSLMGTIANGGTMYWLQYPKTQEEVAGFVPKIKRELDIQAAVPELKPGMMGAVDFGTARRAAYSSEEPILGKTGTCTDARTHLGWFGSFNEVNGTRLVVTVLLTGGNAVNGPVASGIAGQVYKNLSEQQWFARSQQLTPSAEALAGTSGYYR